MGLSYSQWREMVEALGCPERAVEHPAASGRSEREVLRERFGIGEEVPVSKAPDDGMNKTERAFVETLVVAFTRCWICQWRREPMTFRLAGRTRYTPDFGIWPRQRPGDGDWRYTLVEVKGFMRDDAAVKIKVAADLYPQFRWLLVKRAGRHDWDVREVNSRGIRTPTVRIPWIHGG